MIHFSTSLIRELRGSPLTVLIAILLLEQNDQVPVTARLLKDVTGYGDHTLTDCLRALESPTRQMVVRVPGGWKISSGFQLPFEIQNRDIRDNLPTTTTTRIEGGKEIISEVEVLKYQNREKRVFTPVQLVINKILKDARVGEPVRTELSWANDDPLFILSHCIQASWENIEIGLLIHRIRYKDVPEEKYRRKAQKELETRYL